MSTKPQIIVFKMFAQLIVFLPYTTHPG